MDPRRHFRGEMTTGFIVMSVAGFLWCTLTGRIGARQYRPDGDHMALTSPRPPASATPPLPQPA